MKASAARSYLSALKMLIARRLSTPDERRALSQITHIGCLARLPVGFEFALDAPCHPVAGLAFAAARLV